MPDTSQLQQRLWALIAIIGAVRRVKKLPRSRVSRGTLSGGSSDTATSSVKVPEGALPSREQWTRPLGLCLAQLSSPAVPAASAGAATCLLAGASTALQLPVDTGDFSEGSSSARAGFSPTGRHTQLITTSTFVH